MTTVQERLDRIMGYLRLGTREEAQGEAIRTLTNDEKLKYTSNLKPGEEDDLAIALSFADTLSPEYDMEWLYNYVYNKLALRCSIGGLRAGQLAQIGAEARRIEQQRGILDKLFHRKEKKIGEVEPFE